MYSSARGYGSSPDFPAVQETIAEIREQSGRRRTRQMRTYVALFVVILILSQLGAVGVMAATEAPFIPQPQNPAFDADG